MSEQHTVTELYIGFPYDESVGERGLFQLWTMPEPITGTPAEINAFCDEVQALFAKHLGEDIVVNCDALDAIAAQAEQAYADDLAELDRIVNDPEYQPYTEEIDLEDCIESDFQFDVNRERALSRR